MNTEIVGSSPQDLTGWVQVSEKGNQAHPLAGVLEPSRILRIWALAKDAGKQGFDYGFDKNIWNNSERDPTVLYDHQGEEVARK